MSPPGVPPNPRPSAARRQPDPPRCRRRTDRVLLDRDLRRLTRVAVLDGSTPGAATRLGERLRAGGCELIVLPVDPDPATLRDLIRYADLLVLTLTGPGGLVPPGDAPGVADAVACSVLGVVAGA
jgi:hypothetical protein